MRNTANHDHTDIVPGSLEYFPLLFTDNKHRKNINTILQLSSKWRNTVIDTREPSVARIKLAWWEQELDRIRIAKGSHPISLKNRALSSETTNALALLLDRYTLLLDNHIEVGSMTMAPDQYGPLTHWAICVEQQSDADDTVKSFSHELGMAWELCQRILSRSRTTPDEIRVIVPNALGHLRNAILPRTLRRHQRFGIILARVLEKWLKKFEQKEFSRKNSLPLLHQLIYSWRTALKCR